MNQVDTQVGVSAGGISTTIPAGLVVAVFALFFLAGGGLVVLAAFYHTLRSGLKTEFNELINSALELRFSKHENAELSWRNQEQHAREQMGNDFRREVDQLKSAIGEVKSDVRSVREALDRHGTEG